MPMQRIASVALALCFAAAIAHAQQGTPSPSPAAKPAAAATIAGTWTGTFKDMDANREETAMIVLKQDGDVVTGTAGPNADQQFAIAKGKVATTKDGMAVTFELSNGDSMVVLFDLKLIDGHLKGGATAERNGQKLNAQVDVVRAK
jgi:basic membrane lipoprotein Med (substrate-binding protein (PBP1-ABC) superfamily)